jgi:hypothetical protein
LARRKSSHAHADRSTISLCRNSGLTRPRVGSLGLGERLLVHHDDGVETDATVVVGLDAPEVRVDQADRGHRTRREGVAEFGDAGLDDVEGAH